MSWRKRKTDQKTKTQTILQAVREEKNPFRFMEQYTPLSPPELRLYESIREGVPIIDSAIYKMIRLTGGFSFVCENKQAEKKLEEFSKTVNVSGVGMGLENFASEYLDELLTYGNAVGEIVLDGERSQIVGLYLANPEQVKIKEGKNPLEVDFYVQGPLGIEKVENKSMILFTALNPKAGEYTGTSILRSLPFVTDILLKIYTSIGQNFDRIGNVRYAVTYNPGNDPTEKAYAPERAKMIAKEWSEGMSAGARGQVRDFISVGDVSIKVIGADNQMIETDVPVRQMLEQIVAKLSIPPFLLGLSWSTTERMSQQQTDILVTELEYYRRLLTPVLLKIARTYLRLSGYGEEPQIVWNTVTLKDEAEAAKAKLYSAQAEEILERLKGGEKNGGN